MFQTIIIPMLALGIMGAVFGALLSVASKIFKVEQDERLPQILEVLPGANCGGCGYPGCSNFAGAVVDGTAKVNGCVVGGNDVASQVARIMGVVADEAVKLTAHVHCSGGKNARKKYVYEGIGDCLAASKIQGGPLDCSAGCLGFGTCAKACPYGAIQMVDGVAKVMADKCKACGKCVAACPRHLISIVSYEQDVFVSCSNHDKGGELRTICNIGCIGCGLCVKACEFDAIHVENFLAHIDYDKCTNCGKCALVCPRKLISNASEITGTSLKNE